MSMSTVSMSTMSMSAVSMSAMFIWEKKMELKKKNCLANTGADTKMIIYLLRLGGKTKIALKK